MRPQPRRDICSESVVPVPGDDSMVSRPPRETRARSPWGRSISGQLSVRTEGSHRETLLLSCLHAIAHAYQLTANLARL
jgi:hypothetical protein